MIYSGVARFGLDGGAQGARFERAMAPIFGCCGGSYSAWGRIRADADQIVREIAFGWAGHAHRQLPHPVQAVASIRGPWPARQVIAVPLMGQR